MKQVYHTAMAPPHNPSSDKPMFDVLMPLLDQGSITAEFIETYIGEYPELLGEEAQTWLSLLTDIQDTDDAREQVKRLARILTRSRSESIHFVVTQEAVRSRALASRQRREARLRTAREEFLGFRAVPKVKPQNSPLLPPLPSLSEIMVQLRSISTAENPEIFGDDLLAGESVGDPIPEYLFRGESHAYPTTPSSMARLRLRLAHYPQAIEDISRICSFLVSSFQEQWGLTEAEAFGFLQHYGFPTDYIDLTSDTSVAASFASRLKVGDEGAICIIPTKQLKSAGGLVDLRHHQLAERPRKQSAFAISGHDYPDLKALEVQAVLGLTWIPFRLTEVDAARFVPNFELLDARSDRIAGLIWLMIDDFGKVDDNAALSLSKTIDPAPFYAVARNNGEMVIVSEDDVLSEIPVEDQAFRDTHRERWSDRFKEPVRTPLPPELEKAISHGPIEPGSVLQILNSKVFRRKVSDR